MMSAFHGPKGSERNRTDHPKRWVYEYRFPETFGLEITVQRVGPALGKVSAWEDRCVSMRCPTIYYCSAVILSRNNGCAFAKASEHTAICFVLNGMKTGQMRTVSTPIVGLAW